MHVPLKHLTSTKARGVYDPSTPGLGLFLHKVHPSQRYREHPLVRLCRSLPRLEGLKRMLPHSIGGQYWSHWQGADGSRSA